MNVSWCKPEFTYCNFCRRTNMDSICLEIFSRNRLYHDYGV